MACNLPRVPWEGRQSRFSIDPYQKQFFRRHRARRQALLVHEAADRLPGWPVGLDAVSPEILAEHAPILLDVVDQPRQRDAQRVGVIEAVDRDRLGVAERLVDTLCDPRMLAMHVLAHHHGMHDREDLGALVVMSLDRLEVREQTRDRGRAVEEELRNVEREQGIELARRKHRLERFPALDELELDRLRQVERYERRLDEGIQTAHEPMHVLGFHTKVVLQEASHEAEPGRAPLRGADALALEVAGFLDAGIAAHIDAGMAKNLGERDRHRHEWAVAARFERGVGGQRELRDLKLLTVEHALEALAGAQNLDVELDPRRLDAAVHQRTGAVIIPTGKRKLEVGHSPPDLASTATASG